MARPTVAQLMRRLPFPLARRRCPAASSRRRREQGRRRLRHRLGPLVPGRARAGAARRGRRAPAIDVLAAPTVDGLDRLDDLDGPVVFAANHHSHVDTPLLLSVDPRAVAPPPRRSAPPPTTSSATASRSTLSALVIGAIPIERTKVSRTLGRPGRRAHRRRLEHADLPRGRPQPRRLGPAVPRRRRLPVAALRGAGRADPRRGHRPHPAQGQDAAPTVDHTVTFGWPHASRRGRGLAPVRGPHRSEPSPSSATRPPPTGGRPASGPTGTTPSLQGPEHGAWRRTWALGRAWAEAPSPAGVARPRLTSAITVVAMPAA